jgi:serine protease Do
MLTNLSKCILRAIIFCSLLSSYKGHAPNLATNPAPIPNLTPAPLQEPADTFKGFADILKKKEILKAVVNISATSFNQNSEMMPNFQMPEGPLGEMLKDLLNLKGKPQKITSLGSGVVKEADGLIVTNYHVIQHALKNKGEIWVTFNSGDELLATVVGVDFRSDLALLKVNPSKPLVFLDWGDSEKTEVGDYVLAIGNPYGFGGTVTQGILSAKYRNLPSKNGEGSYIGNWFQTNAAINSGSSGGPLINMQGQVIGINTAIFTPTGGNIGIAFAIPSSEAIPIIQALKQNGCVKRGWIGVKLGSTITENLAKNLGLPQMQGVIIDDVIPQTPAYEAGLRTGDIILKIGNTLINNPHHVRSLVSAVKPGEHVNITVWKSKAKEHIQTVNIVVKEMGNEFCHMPSNLKSKSFNNSVAVLGITLKNIKDIPSNRYKLDKSLPSGMVVVEIEANSPAIEILRPGDIVLAVGFDSVSSFEDFQRIIQNAIKSNQKTILVRIARAGEGITHVTIPLNKNQP